MATASKIESAHLQWSAPPKNHIVVGGEQFEVRTLIERACSGWQAVEDQRSLADVISDYEENKGDVSTETIEHLTEWRKKGFFVRSTCRLLDRRHAAPKNLCTLLKRIGSVKDKKNPAKRLKKLAHLKSAYAEYNHDPVNAEAFIETDQEGFHETMQEIIANIERCLTTPVLSFKGFHNLRKTDVRDVSNLMRLLEEDLSEGHPHKHAQGRWRHLNRTLGKRHDALLEKEPHPTIDYERKTVDIENEIRNEFRELIEMLR